MSAICIRSRPQPIPWSAVHRWCDANRVPEPDRDDLHGLVMAMDRAFIAWRNERITAEMKQMLRG